MNRARAAIPSAPARMASRGRPGMLGTAIGWSGRPRSGASAPTPGRRSRRRTLASRRPTDASRSSSTADSRPQRSGAGSVAWPAGPGQVPPAPRAVWHRPSPRPPRRHRLRPPRGRRSPDRSRWRRRRTARADPPRCRRGPGPRRSDCSGTRTRMAPGTRRARCQRLRHPRHRQRPPLQPPQRPTVAERPSRAAGSAGRADPAGSSRRRRGILVTVVHGRRPGRRSGRSRLDLPHPVRARPRGVPNPGTWGRPGTRSTGSTPPGARRPAARVAIRRSSGVGGPGSSIVHRGRRRTRRTDRPGHRPCWAALARSSAR